MPSTGDWASLSLRQIQVRVVLRRISAPLPSAIFLDRLGVTAAHAFHAGVGAIGGVAAGSVEDLPQLQAAVVDHPVQGLGRLAVRISTRAGAP